MDVASSSDTILIDTDIFTYLFKNSAEAYKFRPFVEKKMACVSFATAGELFFGAFSAGWGEKKILALRKELSNYVIISSNYYICLLYGRIRSQCESSGHVLNDPDYWIAASAIHYDCPLVTNNWKHFRHIPGLRLISPQDHQTN
jgi:tRNA(fMet)-specific endonuclease VapC